MDLMLRFFICIFSFCFVIATFSMIARGRIILKYALLWFFLALVAIVISVWPQWFFWLAWVVGFQVPANFVFTFAIFCLMALCLSFTVIVSRSKKNIIDLCQHSALQDKEIADLKKAFLQVKEETKSKD